MASIRNQINRKREREREKNGRMAELIAKMMNVGGGTNADE